MALNATPAAERIHIGFFGKRNAGKSSVMNAVTGQDLAIVSEQKGTTTDPVYKTMELLPLGPVMLMDTPGLDDEGALGELRVKKAYQALNKADIALVVIDAVEGPSKEDFSLLSRIQKKEIPYLIIWNKEDLLAEQTKEGLEEKKRETEALFFKDEGRGFEDQRGCREPMIWISAGKGTGIEELKEKMAHLLVQEKNSRQLVGDLIQPGNMVVLVVPIDKASPKGRLILPQQQTIRDILDNEATAVVVRDLEYKDTLEKLGKKPDLVITDSQVFARVSAETPVDVPLTSFSIVFARYKGLLFPAVAGARALEKLRDGDRVLISEGCTHHRQCGDIGTVKLPGWIREYTKKTFEFCFSSGTEFPEELENYQMIVHCGACMLNEKEMRYRISCAADQGVPITNYGILIAYMHGILERSLDIFGM